MRAFPVPVQITEEERLFGGILSLRQLLYIIAGVALGGVPFAISFLPVIIRLFIFALIASSGFILAFISIYGMRADQFIYLLIKWRRSQKGIYLRGNS